MGGKRRRGRKAELIERLKQIKRNYFRYGISLDARFQTAFLETELNGNAMLYGGPSVATATLNEANFNRYAKRARGFDKISVADVEKFHVFSTQALLPPTTMMRSIRSPEPVRTPVAERSKC
ncbi:hypothetical protein DEA98_19150 [Brucella pseudogrignonensis]|nr:hypothetical protein [Brucella pseudogrignonensis]